MQDSASINQPDDVNCPEEQAFLLAGQGALEIIELMGAADRLKLAGRKDLTISLYRLWLEHTTSPLVYVGYFNLGVELASERDYLQSEIMYRKTLELSPDFIRARLNLGNCLEQQKREDEALEQWQIALKSESILLPENLPLQLHALNNLGRLLEVKKNYQESLAMLEKSFSLDPAQRDVLLHLVHLIQKICRWPIYTPPKGITKEEMINGTSPLAMLAASDDPALQLFAAKQFVEHKYPVTSCEALAPKGGYKHEKIRIGYLSSDFCLHAVSLLTVELLEMHDHDLFEVYGFCWSREDGTAFQKRVIKAMDHYIKIGEMSDKDAADCIRSHEIDIMIDLQGLTSGARPLILSYRPATLQVTYLGFPGTTGLPWIDYVIADKYLIPDELIPFHTEKPLYMPNCFQSSDSKREVGIKPTRSANELPDKAFVFCSFNNNYKFTPEVFAVWMRILKRVPGSVFWLLADNEWSRENLIKVAKKMGVKKERLVFAPRVAPADYLARYQLADLFLDTFPFNGGTTANDALFMGLPLLTLSGRTFASRMAGSLLTNLGLPELITTNLKEYEEKAVRLAKKPAEMERIKAKLADRKTNVVFDIQALTRDIEKQLTQTLRSVETTGTTLNEVNTEPVDNTDAKEENIKPFIFKGREMKLPELPVINPTVVRSFHSDVSWGISDPVKFAQLMSEAAKLVTPGHYLGDNLFTWGRNNSLFEDAAFVQAWQKNIINGADQAIAWRRYILACSACHCIQFEGDFVECGVYQGSGIKTVIDYFGASKFDRTFWGYDTFDYNPVEGHSFAGQEEGFYESVKQRFDGYSQVNLIRGLLPDSLKGNSPEKISYLHLDLNSAVFEVAVLEELFDRVVAGGMIILDDYEWSGIYRQQKILEDGWFEKRNYRVFPLPTGQGFLIKR